MDRNTILGAVLIFSILIGFSYFNKPSEKQLAIAKHQRDSIEQVRADQEKKIVSEKALEVAKTDLSASTNNDSLVSGANQALKEKFGVFADASIGKEKFYTVENNLIKVTFSNKGGRIYSVELKNYKTFDGKPLILFEGTTSKFGMNFFAQNRSIETESFYFIPSDSTPSQIITGPEVKIGREGMEKFNTGGANSSKSISMRLMAGDGKYLEYRYSLSYNSYLVGFEMSTQNLSKIITTNSNYLNFNWKIEMPRQEKQSKMGEDSYSTIYYKYQTLMN